MASALKENDPLRLQLRETELEQNLGFCYLKVNATTAHNLYGLEDAEISGFRCIRNECLAEDEYGECIEIKVEMGFDMRFLVLHGKGIDESIWTCGDELPVREIKFSYNIIDTQISVRLELLITYEGILQTPRAKVIDVSKFSTGIGMMTNHHCESTSGLNMVDPILRVFCKPMLELAKTVLNNLYLPMVGHVLSVLISVSVEPATDQLDRMLKLSGANVAGYAVLCVIICCLVVRVRRAERAALEHEAAS